MGFLESLVVGAADEPSEFVVLMWMVDIYVIGSRYRRTA